MPDLAHKPFKLLNVLFCLPYGGGESTVIGPPFGETLLTFKLSRRLRRLVTACTRRWENVNGVGHAAGYGLSFEFFFHLELHYPVKSIAYSGDQFLAGVECQISTIRQFDPQTLSPRLHIDHVGMTGKTTATT